MPIFDYTCKDCGGEFEALVLGANEEVKCPECGSVSVQRASVSLFSCFGAQLDKRLKLESEEQMVKGRKWMSKQKMRKSRIKVL